MTTQLRRRIMYTMMILLSITFISIIIAINVWIRAGSRAEADSSLRFLIEREMQPGMPPDKNGQPEPDRPQDFHREIATAHFILIRYTPEKQLLSIENSLSDRYSDELIRQYAEEILATARPYGTIGHLRYTVRQNNKEIVIAFIDHSLAEKSAGKLLVISVILGIAGLTAFALLSYFLSGLMIHPVEEAFQKQKQFISDASHELKTPIAVILSNSELLTDQIGENRQLSYIKGECDRMHHLVNSLLTLTRLEQEPYKHAEKNTFCLSDALLERILPMESIAFERGITIQEDITPNITFWGAKEQLQQVAAIFMDNALTHTAEKGRILVSLHQTQHHIVFTVSNTGDPIPENEREKLFERFYRTDKARNRSGRHYGLGLSIARSIISNHRGKIHVECLNGMNSFIVTLRAGK